LPPRSGHVSPVPTGDDLQVKVANSHRLLGDTVLANFVVGIMPPRNGYECVARYG
jgi:hypothetical protein